MNPPAECEVIVFCHEHRTHRCHRDARFQLIVQCPNDDAPTTLTVCPSHRVGTGRNAYRVSCPTCGRGMQVGPVALEVAV